MYRIRVTVKSNSGSVDVYESLNIVYDAGIPQNEGLFSLYKDLGYTIPLRRCEYELSSIDITPASDLREVWLYKKALHKSCRSGFSLIENEKQFFETVREHKIFSYDGGYLAFYKKNGAYKLYSIISSDPLHAPASLVHYERSALIFNITNKLDAEKMEKEKPSLPFLMS